MLRIMIAFFPLYGGLAVMFIGAAIWEGIAAKVKRYREDKRIGEKARLQRSYERFMDEYRAKGLID